MCDNHVHRVYICQEQNEKQQVVGVVTPTDILSLIAGQAGWLRRTLSMKSNGGNKRPAADAAAAALNAAADVAAAVAAAEAEAAVAGQGDALMQAAEEGTEAAAAAAAAVGVADGQADGNHKKVKT